MGIATGYLRRLKGEEIEESFLRQLFLDGKSASENEAKGPEPVLPEYLPCCLWLHWCMLRRTPEMSSADASSKF